MYQYPFQYGQQFQPQQQFALPVQQPMPGIMGHMIGSHEEIKPNDVPMNGSPAYFPTQDGSLIYAKAWNPDGSITTVRYAPITEEQPEQQGGPTLIDIMDQLSDIQDAVNALSKPRPVKRTTTKKETTDDASE